MSLFYSSVCEREREGGHIAIKEKQKRGYANDLWPTELRLRLLINQLIKQPS